MNRAFPIAFLLLAASASLILLPTAHAEDPSTVAGTVVDARTRAPLPRYALELRAGSRADRVISDEKGRFTSAISFLPGDVSIRAIDDESVARAATDGGLELAAPIDAPITVRFAGAPLEIAVPVGPTIQLAWKPANDENAPQTVATSTAWLVCTEPGAVDEGVSRHASVRIESDGRSWVRFAPLPSDVKGCAGGARLRIVAIDNKWMAEADVASALASPAQPVELSWRPCARWFGALKDGQGNPVAGSWVVLERSNDRGGVEERRRARCDVTGGYDFRGLEPGRFRLRSDPLRFQAFQSEPRDLAPAEHAKLYVTLDAVRQRESIQGRIEGAPSVEGEKAPQETAIVLRRAGESLPQDTVRPSFALEGGRWVALFVVPNLPLGEYDLELVPPPGDAGSWTATTLRAKAGGTVVFTRR